MSCLRRPWRLLPVLLAAVVSLCCSNGQDQDSCNDLYHVQRQAAANAVVVHRLRDAMAGAMNYRIVHAPNTEKDSSELRRVQALQDSLWGTDSISMAWTLAWMTSTEEAATRPIAENAARAYHRLWGRSEPMLAVLEEYASSDERRALALSAIRGPFPSDDRRVIRAFVCEAANHMKPFMNDTTFGGRVSGPPEWFVGARNLVRDARGILGSEDPVIRKVARDLHLKDQ